MLVANFSAIVARRPVGANWAAFGFDASQTFHNYAFEWLADKIRWYVDGKLVSETPEGAKIPRNPGHLHFMPWSGLKTPDTWTGPFNYARPVTAEMEWAAYTPTGRRANFRNRSSAP